MSADTDDFLLEHGFGRLERRLRLGGRLAVDGGPELPVELCLTPSGVWVVARDGRFVGNAVDAADPKRVRYQSGKLSDRIAVGEHALSVPTGRAGEARRLIALGRLRKSRAAGERNAPTLHRDRYCEDDGELARELVAVLLSPREELIALLELDRDEAVSELGPRCERKHWFVLSSNTAYLAKLGELGDLESVSLEATELRVETGADGAVLSDGKTRQSLPLKRQVLLAEVCELGHLGPAERLMESARRLHLGSKGAARPRQLLWNARQREQPLAGILELALDAKVRESIDANELALRVNRLRHAEISPETLAEAFRRWHFGVDAGREVLRALARLGTEAEPWWLVLHRSFRALAIADPERSDEELTRWDVELAEHELSSGDGARARSLAEARLRTLGPDEDAVEVATRDSQSRLARVRLYEVLCREARARNVDDVSALGALARLEPLSEARLAALANATPNNESDTRLIQRARRVQGWLAKAGLSAESPPGPKDEGLPFERSTLEQRLQHPLARGGGRLATRLSELVAAVPEPDLGFLRDFCEELSETRHPDATRALTRAARLLNLPRVSAYVSHGARSVGLRAFGSSEPFVLIGERHLTNGDCSLRGTELDFALGAELAHLAFGHQRVTAGEVWAGAADKTKDALAALGLVLPVVVDLGGPRVQRVISRLGAEAFERATRGALRLPELFGGRSGSGEPLSQRNEELILAHRLVQLSADRAGLAIAQDLGGALRAMLLTRAEYRELVNVAASEGLVTALEARRAQSPAVADLLLRVRAIIAFYLSPEFDPFSVPPDAA